MNETINKRKKNVKKQKSIIKEKKDNPDVIDLHIKETKNKNKNK